MQRTSFAKHVTFIRGWLIGKEYNDAIRAMNYAQKFHKGTRKDGVTHEFEHQVHQVQYVRTLETKLIHPQETFVTIFLHDTPEDYGVGFEEILQLFGPTSTKAIERMTKKYRGEQKSKEQYYNELALCPIASVAKGSDRIHNIHSMQGVFSYDKQSQYIQEVKEYILPMLKEAKRNFPTQESIYENIKWVLTTYIRSVEHCLEICKCNDIHDDVTTKQSK